MKKVLLGMVISLCLVSTCLAAPTFKELTEMSPENFEIAIDEMGGADLVALTKEISYMIVTDMKKMGLDRNLLKTIFSDPGAKINLRKRLSKIAESLINLTFSEVLDKTMLDILIVDLTYNLLDRLEVYAITGI